MFVCLMTGGCQWEEPVDPGRHGVHVHQPVQSLQDAWAARWAAWARYSMNIAAAFVMLSNSRLSRLKNGESAAVDDRSAEEAVLQV